MENKLSEAPRCQATKRDKTQRADKQLNRRDRELERLNESLKKREMDGGLVCLSSSTAVSVCVRVCVCVCARVCVCL